MKILKFLLLLPLSFVKMELDDVDTSLDILVDKLFEEDVDQFYQLPTHIFLQIRLYFNTHCSITRHSLSERPIEIFFAQMDERQERVYKLFGPFHFNSPSEMYIHYDGSTPYIREEFDLKIDDGALSHLKEIDDKGSISWSMVARQLIYDHSIGEGDIVETEILPQANMFYAVYGNGNYDLRKGEGLAIRAIAALMTFRIDYRHLNQLFMWDSGLFSCNSSLLRFGQTQIGPRDGEFYNVTGKVLRRQFFVEPFEI